MEDFTLLALKNFMKCTNTCAGDAGDAGDAEAGGRRHMAARGWEIIGRFPPQCIAPILFLTFSFTFGKSLAS